MKRCPQCNRAEPDDALAFCRADGTALVSDSSQLSGEAGTAKLGSASAATEIETSILPHATDADMNRVTASTTVLPAQPAGTTSSLTKPKRRKTAIALAIIVTAVVAADGAPLVSDSSPLSIDVGTARLGSASIATEIETSILPHTTAAGMNRPTAPATALSGQPAPS